MVTRGVNLTHLHGDDFAAMSPLPLLRADNRTKAFGDEEETVLSYWDWHFGGAGGALIWLIFWVIAGIVWLWSRFIK